jgi:hypothetical protein
MLVATFLVRRVPSRPISHVAFRVWMRLPETLAFVGFAETVNGNSKSSQGSWRSPKSSNEAHRAYATRANSRAHRRLRNR